MPNVKSLKQDQLAAFKRASDDSHFGDKLIAENRLRTRSALWKKTGWSVVLATGVFDILHVGHIRLLRQASYRGDILVVGVNSDESARKLKGESRPVVPQGERVEMLASLSCVDYVVVFEGETAVSLINMVKPNYWVKGGDYLEEDLLEKPFVEKHGGKIVILPFERGHSSTTVIDRIAEFGV